MGRVIHGPILPQDMDLDADAPEVEQAPQVVSDAWNFWVFSLRGSASYSAEQTSREVEWRGSASGDRVTANRKLSFGLSSFGLDGSVGSSLFNVVNPRFPGNGGVVAATGLGEEGHLAGIQAWQHGPGRCIL